MKNPFYFSQSLKLIPLCLMLLSFIQVTAQDLPIFKGFEVNNLEKTNNDVLKTIFKTQNIYDLNVSEINEYAKSQTEGIDFQLDLGKAGTYDVYLERVDYRAPSYTERVMTEKGEVVFPERESVTYKGSSALGLEHQIRMTIAENQFYGYFNIDGEEIFIEPLHNFIEGVDRHQVVVYNAKNVIPKKGTCDHSTTFDQVQAKKDELKNKGGEFDKSSACYVVQIAYGADYGMYNRHGGVAGAHNHIHSILNLVNNIYENNVSTLMVVTDSYLSSCSSCDPWTSSTNGYTLRDNFANWAYSGGFNQPHQAGSLWTTRNIYSPYGAGYGLVGVAQTIGGVCSSLQYNINEDYSSSSTSLSRLWAHEMGHTFGAYHDSGTGYIMASSTGGFGPDFSSTSKNSIGNHLSSVSSCVMDNCTQSCGAFSSSDFWASNITSTSAKINWVENGAYYYKAYYRKLGTSSWTSVGKSYTNYQYFYYLQPNTTYQYHVRVFCPSGVYYSSTKTFKTSYGKNDGMALGDTEVSIYPNPTQDYLTIENIHSSDIVSLNIYDTAGKLVKRIDPQTLEGNRRIDLSDLETGLYILNINDTVIKKINKM